MEGEGYGAAAELERGRKIMCVTCLENIITWINSAHLRHCYIGYGVETLFSISKCPWLLLVIYDTVQRQAVLSMAQIHIGGSGLGQQM